MNDTVETKLGVIANVCIMDVEHVRPKSAGPSCSKLTMSLVNVSLKL